MHLALNLFLFERVSIFHFNDFRSKISTPRAFETTFSQERYCNNNCSQKACFDECWFEVLCFVGGFGCFLLPWRQARKLMNSQGEPDPNTGGGAAKSSGISGLESITNNDCRPASSSFGTDDG